MYQTKLSTSNFRGLIKYFNKGIMIDMSKRLTKSMLQLDCYTIKVTLIILFLSFHVKVSSSQKPTCATIYKSTYLFKKFFKKFVFANSYLELILCRLLSPFSFSSTSIKLNVFGLMYDGKTYKLHQIVIHLQCQNECRKRFQMIEIRLLLF